MEDYIIKRNGEIYSNISKKVLKPYKNHKGYFLIDLKGRKAQSVHRIIDKKFIPNPKNKPQVNHINGVKTDNRVENLEWVTPSENCVHAFKLGLRCNKGDNHPSNKLTEQKVREILKMKQETKKTQKEISALYGVSIHAIYDLSKGKTWGHITNG